MKSPVKYERGFLYTETDDNDLTYFVCHQLDVIDQAIGQLHEYVQRKGEQIRNLEARIPYSQALNYRQRALHSHVLRHRGHRYTI